MDLNESLELLSKYGIKTSGRIIDLKEALELKRPLVLKANTSEHKMEQGMVFTNLKTDAEIKGAYLFISKKHRVFAQPMIKGFEFMAGAVIDSIFGEVIMVGLGGTYAELFRDTSFRAPPLTQEDAVSMINDLKSSKVFSGFRGKKLNISALSEILVKLSNLSQKISFKEMDLNPIMVDESKAVVVDARVIK